MARGARTQQRKQMFLPQGNALRSRDLQTPANSRASKGRPKSKPIPIERIARTPTRGSGDDIDPRLKAFIARAVVPTLVRDFLAGSQNEKKIAKRRRDVASFGVPSAGEVA